MFKTEDDMIMHVRGWSSYSDQIQRVLEISLGDYILLK